MRLTWVLKKLGACAIALGPLAVAAPAWAHHSTAAYDYATSDTLSGTVKEFQWTNPHMYIFLVVDGPANKVTQWTIECGTPNINVRHGWQYGKLMVDRITIDDPDTFIHPWDTVVRFRRLPSDTEIPQDICLDRTDAGKPAVAWSRRLSE